ncbi:hypothetical protein [Bradyrhizobium nitroreducens]|uniref:hypothetical protein n=1 Tax=Bradyrhizobium nitroreducens TaxID=709803 RepID=UPI0011AE2B6B|nr:hypothetical protein [Bradyrhizobium nitroreducens]
MSGDADPKVREAAALRGTSRPLQIGRFCRDGFAAVTELLSAIGDKSLMNMNPRAGMRVARRSCVRK